MTYPFNQLPQYEDAGSGKYSKLVKVMGNKQKSVQAYSASVSPTTSVFSAWIDTDGFDKFELTFKNDAATSANVTIEWSHDGVTIHGEDTNVSTGTAMLRTYKDDTSARYMQLKIYNGDTVAHTMTAYLYLKA